MHRQGASRQDEFLNNLKRHRYLGVGVLHHDRISAEALSLLSPEMQIIALLALP